MYPKLTRKVLVLLAGLSAFGMGGTRPASAQSLLYTFSGVTFSDGATATGTFVYDPTLSEFGAYDLTTTNGLTDTLAGYQYKLGTAFIGGEGFSFQLADGDPYHSPGGGQYLELITTGEPYPGAVSPGTYALLPGQFTSSGTTPSTEGSVEYTVPVGAAGFVPGTPRTISGGFLIVTNNLPVPEASTFLSLGLLLMLGLGGAAAASRSKKRQPSSEKAAA